MKYKIGDKVVLRHPSWATGATRVKTTLWEVVERKAPYLICIRECGTDYQASWIDVSMVEKAK